MHGRWRSATTALTGLALLWMLGCGRSEQVGWTDGENDAEDGGAESGAMMNEGVQTGEADAQALMLDYQQRAQALEDLRVQAMQDDTLQEVWGSLNDDVDERMVEMNPELESLMTRAGEIENRVVEAQRAGDTISMQEQQMLAMQYQNIQNTLGQARNAIYQEEQFSDRLNEFQRALYEEMRQLDPDRAVDVDTLEQLGDRIIVLLDSIREAGSAAESAAAGGSEQD